MQVIPTVCIFQFVTLKNTTTLSPTHYSINIINNLYIAINPLKNLEQKKCSYPLYYFTPHCWWVSNAAFQNYSPKNVY